MYKLTAYDKFIQMALKYGFSLFGLPKTGQIISYNAGDDGVYEAGYPKSGTRFIDNGDETVSDMATGLMWLKDPDGDAGVVRASWAAWLTAVERLDFAGHSDWRAPNIRELQSLIDYTKFNTCFPSVFIFQPFWYWSSTTSISSTTKAWYIDAISGNISTSDKLSAVPWRYGTAVRGGI